MRPVFVVGAVLSLLITSRLEIDHGNAAGFLQFGQRFVQYTPIHQPGAG